MASRKISLVLIGSRIDGQSTGNATRRSMAQCESAGAGQTGYNAAKPFGAHNMPKPDSPKRKNVSFGASRFRTSNPQALSADTKVVSLVLSFEDALKLNLAVDSGVHHLGRLNRATESGRRRGLKLMIHFDKQRLRVQVGMVPKSSKGQSEGQLVEEPPGD